MHKSNFCIALFLLLLSSATLMAQEPALVIAKEDQDVVIRGTLSGNTTSFSKTITIAAVGGDVNQTRVLKSRRFDLREVGGGGVIERSNISVPAVTFTKDQQQQDVTITVNNVTRFGTFKGQIKFWLPEQNEDAAQVVNLTLETSPRVDVKAPAAATAQLVRCSPLPCSLNRWLPASLIGEQRWLLLDNQTPIAIKVSDHGIVLQGQKTGRLVTEGDVEFKPPKDVTLPARQPTTIEMKFDRNKLPPDRYAGSIRFNVEGSDVQPTVNFTLDVREAPWWALVALIVGVVIGRLIKSMNTPEALLQAKLIGRVYRIQGAIFSLQDDRDKESLLSRLEVIRKQINAGSETEQTLTAELGKLEAEIKFLSQLDYLQEAVRLHAKPDIKKALQDKLVEAKRAFLEGRVNDCLNLLNEVSTELRLSGDSLTDADEAKPWVELLVTSVDDVRREGANVVIAREVKPEVKPGLVTKAISALAGARLIGAEVRYWLVRPAFFLLLLVLLVLVGLKTLYIDAGTNFGSEGLYDYLGLVLWGMSADVVQRTLQNLQLPKAT